MHVTVYVTDCCQLCCFTEDTCYPEGSYFPEQYLVEEAECERKALEEESKVEGEDDLFEDAEE